MVSLIVVTFLIRNSIQLKKRILVLEDAVNGELVKLSIKTGFYDSNLTFNGKTEKYNYRVYVTELERYDNGYSKLRYDGCTINGNNIETYKTVERYVAKDFLEIQETKNITFLEKNKDVSELRKDKLERILNDVK